MPIFSIFYPSVHPTIKNLVGIHANREMCRIQEKLQYALALRLPGWRMLDNNCHDQRPKGDVMSANARAEKSSAEKQK